MATTAAGRRRGVLLRGASGAGKSSLALRLVEAGWRLVADDRVVVWPSGGAAWGRAPAALAGLVEARGLGIASVPAAPWCAIGLVVDVAPAAERLPDPAFADVAGVRLPRHTLALDAPAASLRLSLALVGGFDRAAMGRI